MWTVNARFYLNGPGITQRNFEALGLLGGGLKQHWEVGVLPRRCPLVRPPITSRERPFPGPRDTQVGFFNETMPPLRKRVDKLALLRLDGDMYQSTWEVLITMYDKLSVGGYVVVDDYGLIGAHMAVVDFRKKCAAEDHSRGLGDRPTPWPHHGRPC